VLAVAISSGSDGAGRAGRLLWLSAAGPAQAAGAVPLGCWEAASPRHLPTGSCSA